MRVGTFSNNAGWINLILTPGCIGTDYLRGNQINCTIIVLTQQKHALAIQHKAIGAGILIQGFNYCYICFAVNLIGNT